jgi:hypothetical protein
MLTTIDKNIIQAFRHTGGKKEERVGSGIGDG